jgi:hypothetical protein
MTYKPLCARWSNGWGMDDGSQTLESTCTVLPSAQEVLPAQLVPPLVPNLVNLYTPTGVLLMYIKPNAKTKLRVDKTCILSVSPKQKPRVLLKHHMTITMVNVWFYY